MAIDLITLQEYKDYQQIVQTKDDVKLSFTITSVSNLIKAYIGSTINDNSDITESFSLDYETNVLFTTQWPIKEIVGITERDATFTDSTVHIDLTIDTDYYLEKDKIYRLNKATGGFSCWAQGPGSVVVTYTAGYDSVPNDIKLAAIELVNHYVKEEFKQTKTILGTTVTNYNNKVDLASGDIPAHVKMLLNSYKLQ